MSGTGIFGKWADQTIMRDLLQDMAKRRSVGEVSVMQREVDPAGVRVVIEVIDPIRIEQARPANDAVHLVSFIEKKRGEVRPVLARDAGNQGPLHATG